MSVVFLPSVHAGAEVAAKIIETERAALDRWSKGDPDGFLEISALDLVYFDPFTEHRLNGRDALKLLYDGIRGQISIDHYEMVNPKVRVSGDSALLTFNLVSHGNEGYMRWNATEVFERKGAQWEIVHSHWSLAQPKLAEAQNCSA
jgi:hypothetical protein